MTEGHARDHWNRMSALMALLANCHRDPKRTAPIKPSDFDPFAESQEPIKADISILKDVFVDGGNQGGRKHDGS